MSYWLRTSTAVDNLTALNAFVPTLGQMIYVTTQRVYYVAVAAGLGEIAGVSGISWKRLNDTSDPNWLTQSTWFVDPAGSDENSGLDGYNPLQTLNEIQKRWGDNPVIGSTVITLASGTYGTDQQTLSFATKLQTDAVVIAGTPSAALASDTVGTYTAPSTVTNRMYLFTGATISDWTPYVGKRIRFTASGAVCFVLLANPFGLGNATAEITQPLNEPVAPNYSAGSFTPTAGLAFVVEDLPLVTRLTINHQGSPSQITDATFKSIPTVIVKSLNARFARFSTGNLEAPEIRVWGSSHESIGAQSSTGSAATVTFNTCFINISNFYIPQVSYSGCGFKSQIPATVTQATTNFWTSFSSCTFEGIGVSVGFGGAFFFNCGFFNSSVDGITTNAQAAPTVISGFCLGSGNARGVSVGNGTVLNKISGFANMKLTGTAGDWRFGTGAIFAWTDAPRAQNYGSFSGTLSGGTLDVSITNLPTDANGWATANTVSGSGATGVLRCVRGTGKFTISSAVAAETSTFSGGWMSPSNAAGGVFAT